MTARVSVHNGRFAEASSSSTSNPCAQTLKDSLPKREICDVLIIGGGPIGLSVALNCADDGKRVIVVDKGNMSTQGNPYAPASSGGTSRQFRVTYSDPSLARLALDTHFLWKKLQQRYQIEVGQPLELIKETGCLWFGHSGQQTTEGELDSARKVLSDLHIPWTSLSRDDIVGRFPIFRDLDDGVEGIFTKIGGTIRVENVRKALLELLSLRSSQGNVKLVQGCSVTKITSLADYSEVQLTKLQGGDRLTIGCSKIVLCTGIYTNTLLQDNFGLTINMPVYQWSSAYWEVLKNAKEAKTMPIWFYFGKQNGRDGNLYYGFPDEREGTSSTKASTVRVAPAFMSSGTPLAPGDPIPASMVVDEDSLKFTSSWISKHMPDVSTEAENGSKAVCPVAIPSDGETELDFVLDFLPPSVPHHRNVIVCAGGWAMKFVPLFGRICADLVKDGYTSYNTSRMSLTRPGILINPYISVIRNGMKSNDGRKKKVAIIGAGMSGLVAAHLLQPHHNVSVFEANTERLGGRIYTHRFRTADGDHLAEMGAMRIPSFHDLTMAYIKKLGGLELIPFAMTPVADAEGEELKGDTLVYVNGCRLSWSSYQINPDRLNYRTSSTEKGKTADELFSAAIAPVKQALLSGSFCMERFLQRFDKHTIRSFLSQETLYSEGAIEFMNVVLNMEATQHTSFIEAIRDEISVSNSVTYSTIQGGMDKLVNRLASHIKDDVFKRFRVDQLELCGNSVSVHYTDGKVRMKDTFDEVICTVPFTVLRQIPRHPRFSPGKEKAIRELYYDHSTKIYLLFRTPWWRKLGKIRTDDPAKEGKDFHINGGHSVSDTPLRFTYYPTVDKDDQPAVILASYTWGSDAAAWERMSEGQIRQSSLEYLSQIHDVNVSDLDTALIDLRVHCWSEDPNACGAFALFTAEQQYTLYNDIVSSEWNGLVHFAGEHTSLDHAWIQGAIHSGVRSALAVHESYTAEEPPSSQRKAQLASHTAFTSRTSNLPAGAHASKVQRVGTGPA